MADDKVSPQLSEPSPPAKSSVINTSDLASQLTILSKVTGGNLHLDVSTNVIITTEDKMHLCFYQYLKNMEKKRIWIAPLGISITIIVTLITSTFNNLWLEAATWKAIFIVSLLLTLGWLVWSIKEACQSGKMEDIINTFKSGGKEELNLTPGNVHTEGKDSG